MHMIYFSLVISIFPILFWLNFLGDNYNNQTDIMETQAFWLVMNHGLSLNVTRFFFLVNYVFSHYFLHINLVHNHLMLCQFNRCHYFLDEN